MRRRFGIFGILLFLVNAVQFNIDGDDNGGGSAGGDGDNGGDGGNAGGSDDNDGGKSGTGDDQNQNNNSGDQGNDVASLPDFAQKMIKDLRAENANSRTKAKSSEERLTRMEDGFKTALGLGDDDQVSPEDQISQLTAQSEQFAVRNAILEVAIEEGLSKEQSDYFGYLLNKEGESLEEGAEVTEERYDELVNLAKGTGSQAGSANSSVDGDNGTDQGAGQGGTGGDAGTVTAEQFGAMGYGEKVQLRAKNEALYNKLFSEASKKGLI